MGIPEIMLNKINYLLNRFSDEEWSGPAWYKIVKKNSNGFPEQVALKFFKAIHLGSGAETEIDGDRMGKLLPKIYKKIPELKEYYLGLIHSHHTMGAFLSQTDIDTAIEQASSDGLFFSTVVASKKEPFETCLTYKDQFGFDRLVYGATDTLVNVRVDKHWQQEANYIQKMKKKRNTYTPAVTTYFNGYGGYSTLNKVGFNDINHAEVNKYEGSTKDEWDKMEGFIDEYEDKKITYHELIEKCRKELPHMDVHAWVDNPYQLSMY